MKSRKRQAPRSNSSMLGLPRKPDLRPTPLVDHQRNVAFEPGTLPAHDVERGQLDAPCRVEFEEGAQHVGFVPGAAFLVPGHGIFEGMEDVVDMDEHSATNPRQDLEEQEVHVAAELGYVGGVDEEDVVRLELLEERERAILKPLLEQAMA